MCAFLNSKFQRKMRLLRKDDMCLVSSKSASPRTPTVLQKEPGKFQASSSVRKVLSVVADSTGRNYSAWYCFLRNVSIFPSKLANSPKQDWVRNSGPVLFRMEFSELSKELTTSPTGKFSLVFPSILFFSIKLQFSIKVEWRVLF